MHKKGDGRENHYGKLHEVTGESAHDALDKAARFVATLPDYRIVTLSFQHHDGQHRILIVYQ